MREHIDRSATALGLFFVVVGLAFLLDRLDVWTIRAAYVPPLILIALGVAVLLGTRRGPGRRV